MAGLLNHLGEFKKCRYLGPNLRDYDLTLMYSIWILKKFFFNSLGSSKMWLKLRRPTLEDMINWYSYAFQMGVKIGTTLFTNSLAVCCFLKNSIMFSKIAIL